MKKENHVDLHIHTNCSDGDYSYEELLPRLEERGITTFSITDHDTTKAYQNMENDENIIPGVEISSIHKGHKLHILGYGIDLKNENLQLLLQEIRLLRAKRVEDLLESLKTKWGISIERTNLQEKVEEGVTIGTPHLIREIRKVTGMTDNTFIKNQYLKGVKVTSYRKEADLVIKTILEAGGIPIWAHPFEVEQEYEINFASFLTELLELGLSGVECYNSLHPSTKAEEYAKYCQEHGLLITGGSDYHGPFVKPTVELGKVTKEKRMIKRKDINLGKEY